MKTRLMMIAALCLAASTSMLACTADATDEGDDSSEEAITARDGGKVEFFQGRDDQWYFRLVGKNGEKLLRSEGYPRAANTKNGLNAMIGATRSRFRVLPSQDGKFYVNVVSWSVSEEIVATSETYASRSAANEAVGTMRAYLAAIQAADRRAIAGQHPTLADSVDGQRVLLFQSEKDSKFYFDLRARNGEIMLVSQAYGTKDAAKGGVESVMSFGIYADRYKVLQSQDGQWYFTLQSDNNRVIARSSETYTRKSSAEEATRTIQTMLRTPAGVPTVGLQ